MALVTAVLGAAIVLITLAMVELLAAQLSELHARRRPDEPWAPN